MRVVIHIGPHRTGSTSIQEFLAASRSRLVDHGVYYPHCGYADNAHHLLAWKILGRSTEVFGTQTDSFEVPETLLRWIREADELECDTLLLSSEDFAVFRRSEWLALREQFAEDVELSVVYVKRDPAEIAASAHSIMVTNGLAQSFDEVREVLERGARSFYEFVESLEDLSTGGIHEILHDSRNDARVVNQVLEVIVGPLAARSLIDQVAIRHQNSRKSSQLTALLVEFNRLNTPTYVIDVETGEYPAEFYAHLGETLPVTTWVARMLERLDEPSDRVA